MKVPKKNRRKAPLKFTSRLTSKYQATIPKEVREHLHLKSGDVISYEVLPDNTVTVSKAVPLDLDYLKSLELTMNEWNSDEDEQAFKNL